MNRRERRAAAGNPQTVKDASNHPAALTQAGLDHLRGGRLLDARLCAQDAIAADANHAEALHLMGLLSLHAGQFEVAVEWLSRAIRQDCKPQYLLSLGTSLRHLGRLQEALQVLEIALQLKPDAVELWRHVANVLVDLKRPDQALRCFDRLRQLSPRNPDDAYNCGSMLLQAGRLQEAVAWFNSCEEWQPGHWQTLQKRAVALYGLGRFDDALVDIERAHALDPTQADICNNAAVFLQRLGRYEEALLWFDRALERQPDQPAVYTNKAATLTNLHRFTEALAVYDEVGRRHPDQVEASWGKALLQLLVGNFPDGWAGREVRYRHPGLQIARFSFSEPIWLGREPIDGKTILVHVDEGLGDTLQFVRYVPMVAARGARVILVVQQALVSLLSEVEGVAQCLAFGSAPLPPFDMYCPISSLPLAFATTLDTIPSATPYLPAPALSSQQAWEARLGPHDKFRVGLVWSGNRQHKNDHNRSLPLRALSPILDLDATFVSLQKDLRPEDQTVLRGHANIVDLTGGLTDFAETAALISCLDLVITVDTGVAHLAGASGLPTWILLPYTPDFRWLLDRDDSPWYPTVRLFRQGGKRDYAEVLDRMRIELNARIAQWLEGRDG